MKMSSLLPVVLAAALFAVGGCNKPHDEVHIEPHKILVTSPVLQDVVSTQPYVCRIHSCRHIEVRALESGYLEDITVKEGQLVEEGSLLFKVLPTLYQARLDSDLAEARQAQIEFTNTQKLFEKTFVSKQEVAMVEAKLAKAQAKVDLARAELNFANVKAPFKGIIDRLHEQKGSLIEEGDMLTTLSDNTVMWVYFNVPEARYLEYMANLKENNDLKIELKLANGHIFEQAGTIGAIEADFNNQTGNIPFRADFPNPDRLLRNGQTGTILISRVEKDAVVIPQRATYEILAKKYAYVVEPVAEQAADHGDEHGTGPLSEHIESHIVEHVVEPAPAHGVKPSPEHGSQPSAEHGAPHGKGHGGPRGVVRQREIVIKREKEDIYVIKEGLNATDKIVLEGIRQVRDGEEVEYDFRAPEEVLGHLKYHAE